MHGIGNDFIVIDCRSRAIPRLSRVIKRLSHRRFGIGFDQALILLPSMVADFRMDIYNGDGGRVEMCGNGIRCLAKYIWERELSANDPLTIETLAGIIRPQRAGRQVKVDMGEPILDGERIPVKKSGQVVDHPLKVGGRKFLITAVSMGNPHCVIFVDDVDNFPLERFGALLETNPFFPERVNVEFVEVASERALKMRVWERGAGETLACGTGACATVVAATLKGLIGGTATVHLKGGNLKIGWSKRNNRVFMAGPAEEVFEGAVEI
ncbi:MAG: diaminopimelate epimerase [Deltaproteobacteria bacterium]|nr:diaminopimelate epimerase [Deltaproteobacteria bacterium]